MKDNRLEQRIQHSLNAELSGLNTTSWQRNQFFENATGGNKVKRKLTYSIVLAIVLLLIAATALAAVAGIIFAKRVSATEIADQALLKTYGITAQMQSLFIRETAEGEGGTTVVTYEGRGHLAYVLGKYTVIVDGQTVKSICWSHDGEDTSGGLEASAWGKDQLDEILRIDPKTGKQAQLYTFNPYIERINREHGFDYEAYWEEDEDEYVVVLEGEDVQKAKERQAFSAIDTDENSAYVLLDGTLCYRCWIIVGELSTEETEQDGAYTVYLNLETGAVEDIQFLSERGGGNG